MATTTKKQSQIQRRRYTEEQRAEVIRRIDTWLASRPGSTHVEAAAALGLDKLDMKNYRQWKQRGLGGGDAHAAVDIPLDAIPARTQDAKRRRSPGDLERWRAKDDELGTALELLRLALRMLDRHIRLR
jgi:hypothetical protein